MPHFSRRALWPLATLLTLLSAGPAYAQECFRERPTDPASRYTYGADSATSFAPEGGDFRIWYALSGLHAPADLEGDAVPTTVTTVAAILAEAVEHYRDGLRFQFPLRDGGYAPCSSNGGDGLIDVYLVDFNGADGSIGLEECDGAVPTRCAGFMLVDHQFAAYTDFETGARTVLPHEYFHLVQAAYAVPMATWWSEATAQWAAQQVSPELRDMESYFGVYLANAGRPIDLPPTTAAQPFSYATALFVQYLSEAYDVDIVREVLELLGRQGQDELTALAAALANRNSTLADAFAEFVLWNIATGSRAGSFGYAAAARYPELPLPALASDLPIELSGATSGLSANYFLLTQSSEMEFALEAEPQRTRAFFVPLRETVAAIEEAVLLPTTAYGPGVVVVVGIGPEKRDASYSVTGRHAPAEQRADASVQAPINVHPELAQEGCSLISADRSGGLYQFLLLAPLFTCARRFRRHGRLHPTAITNTSQRFV